MAREERRFRLTLHYDGSNFFGWQVQRDKRTVQGEMQAILERLTGAPRTMTAAGRTDRGVHATGQVAGVCVPSRWTADSLRRALNALLPGDIWVAEAVPAPAGFHARHDATAREYGYRVGLLDASRSPFHSAWCWPLAADLNLDALRATAALLRGEKSFAAFARAGQEERGDRCDVADARWAPWELGVEFTIIANRFLHRMVRYLVGTMVDVARGRRPAREMRALLDGPAGGRLVTSPPAPAAGLFLRRVGYPARAITCAAGGAADHEPPSGGVRSCSKTATRSFGGAADHEPLARAADPAAADPLDSDLRYPLAESTGHP